MCQDLLAKQSTSVGLSKSMCDFKESDSFIVKAHDFVRALLMMTFELFYHLRNSIRATT